MPAIISSRTRALGRGRREHRQFFGDHDDAGGLRERHRHRRVVGLRHRLRLVLADPSVGAAGRLRRHADVERHLTQARNPPEQRPRAQHLEELVERLRDDERSGPRAVRRGAGGDGGLGAPHVLDHLLDFRGRVLPLLRVLQRLVGVALAGGHRHAHAREGGALGHVRLDGDHGRLPPRRSETSPCRRGRRRDRRRRRELRLFEVAEAHEMRVDALHLAVEAVVFVGLLLVEGEPLGAFVIRLFICAASLAARVASKWAICSW